MKKKTLLEVDGVEVPVSSLDKVMYPKTGFTKGDVIHYYIQIAGHMLPHLKDRALSLKRYPDGVDGFFFYEKQCPDHAPDWVKTTRVPKTDGSIDYCVADALPTLVWLAQLANLEFHSFLHRAKAPKRPTVLAFDLDPGPPADILTCCKVGLMLKDLFDALGLQSFPKTSGSKGMQVYVPLNTPVTYDRTKAFAQAVAQALEAQCPDLVVSKMLKKLRDGKVFVDWSQNDDHKTTVNVYSLRAKETPTVSTPVTWEEVASALKRKKPLSFEPKEVFKRLKKHGDLFAPVLTLKQKLPPIRSLA
ncbi:non-homologous end-joining DNA ligase [Prosthecobacter sp. SYSU 5D2]|uniref:non-homologous end-joining DNA ligase n=1 Tax=Prosthecobacter sp. SYSU 5D2 TaxID=3134134 RepID=UPI0031FE8F26